MPETLNNGVRIVYDVVGQGRPLILLHGWCADRSWWTEPGYVDDLKRDHLVINVDIRGHGESDKPHEPVAYTADILIGDVLAVADAERVDRFAIWGQSYGGRRMAWIAANAVPERVPAIITTGAWDPGPVSEEAQRWFDENWALTLRSGGTRALLDELKQALGAAFEAEYPAWARAVTLRADPEALCAARAPELRTQGLSNLERFPVPALLIAGEVEDEADDAAKMAATIPHGESLRLPGLGHPGACIASALTIPTARAFLDRWFPWSKSDH